MIAIITEIKYLKSNYDLSWILGEANSGHVTTPTEYNVDFGSSKSLLGRPKTEDMDDSSTEMSCKVRALCLTLKNTAIIFSQKWTKKSPTTEDFEHLDNHVH